MEDSKPEPESAAAARKPPLPIHPFAFAVFPILSLLSTNVGEVLLREVPAPLAIAFGVAIALYLALALVVSDPLKRGIAATVFWLAFYGFAPAVDTIRARFDLHASAGAVQLLFVAIIGIGLYAGLIVWLRKTRRSFIGISSFLNTLAVLALIVPAAQTGYRIATMQGVEGGAVPIAANGGVDSETYPDIYYVIFDAYTREDYLRQVFDYDNAPFLDGLRERGFYIAGRSRSNYMFTQMSLASSLNFEYIAEDLLESVSENWNSAVPRLAGSIGGNRVVTFLKERGYEFVTFPSYVAATEIRSADRFIEPRGIGRMTEFHLALIDRTPIRILWNRIDTPRLFPFFFPLQAMEELERGRRPMFVFAHLMAPHLPHTVDANGNHYETPPNYLDGYRNEVAYLNTRITEVIDAILAKRPNSAFIIQGDHGPWSNWDGNAEGRQDPWQGTSEDYIRDRTAILNAYYFPGAQYEELYPEITPVNSFRVLFNRYFATGLPLLKDESYVYTEDASKYEVITETY